MKFGKIYIVLINYKGHEDTIECIESILKSKFQNFQIIVIDNSPDYVSLEELHKWAEGNGTVKTDYSEFLYPVSTKPLDYIIVNQENLYNNSYKEKIIIVKASQNLGFAAGNNIGIRYALKCNDFNYIWLLNNDTIIFEDTINKMLEPIKQPEYNRVGIIGLKQLYYNNPKRIQACGARFNKYFALGKHIGENELDIGQYDRLIIKSDYVVGASMLVSHDFLIDVGLMCEEYFLYYEEIDWVQRAKNMGYTIKIHQNARILHKQGASIGKKRNRNLIAEYSSIRARIIITKKFFPRYILTVYISVICVLINRLIRFEFSRIPNVLKAIYSGMIYHN